MNMRLRPPTFARTVLGPFVERETYLGLVYSLLGLPLGTFYFVFLVTGVSLGLGLAITLAGIPILVFVILAGRGLAQLERTLSASLLDAEIPHLASEQVEGSLWRRLLDLLRSGETWRELAFLFIRFPTGIASFSIAVSIVAYPLSLIVQPLLVALGVPGAEFGDWRVDSVGKALLLVPPGLALLLLAPTVLNMLAWVERRLAVSFLGRIPRSQFRRAVARSLARGEADAFGLMNDLELYFGPSPFLTPARLEATLLSLEDLGLVESVRRGARERYSLTEAGRAAL